MRARFLRILAGSVVLGVVCVPGSAAAEGPTLETVLERHVEAVGGWEAFEQLSSRIAHYRLVTDLPSRSEPVHEVATLEVYLEKPVEAGQYVSFICEQLGVEYEGEPVVDDADKLREELQELMKKGVDRDKLAEAVRLLKKK